MVRPRVFLAAILCLSVLAGLVSAVAVTVSPDVIQPNDQITIFMSDLKNGSTFTLHIESSITLQDATSFAFKANQLTMPFALQKPKITVDTHPIEPNSEVWVKAKTGSTIKSIGTVADDTNVHISEGLSDIGIGKIDSIEVTGTAPQGTKEVVVAMELSGKKSGPDSSAITFSLTGVTQGTAKVIIYVDDTQAVAKTVYVGSAPATITTTVSSSVYSSSVYTTDIVPRSSDGLATLSTKRVAVMNANPDDLFIVTLPSLPSPSNWRQIAGTYAVSPESTFFDPPAALSVTIPATEASDLAKYQPFLAEYKNGTWNKVSASTSGSVIYVQISKAGKYAIFTENMVTPVTTITTVTQPVIIVSGTAPAGSPATTPVVAGSAQGTTPAPVTTTAGKAVPTTKAAPLAIISVAGALLGALYIFKPRIR